jgi:CubicO group peptidase (beta-lactamase class C family)
MSSQELGPSAGAAMRAFALSCSLFAMPLVAASPEDELVGLWGYGATYGPMLHGELAITRAGDRWGATFGGVDASVEATADEIVAEFPEGHGKFRGRIAGKSIEGFWIRRGVTEDPRYPGGATQPFSSPVVLSPAGANRWTGDVHPLKVRAKLYLKIFRDEEGRLLGAFRDPYQNEIGGASRFLVSREGERIAFSQPNEAGGTEVWFTGAVSQEGLTIDWERLGGEIRLRSLAPDDLHVFHPRPPGEPPYVYREPETIDDGWPTARGRAVGLDERALARAVQKIIDGDPAARSPSLVHSILIARKGRLVLEEYFFGHDRETEHDIRSAGKTFASVMLGAAMMRGVDVSPQTRIYDLMAERGPFSNPDPRKAKITLAHLMTHTSGLDCNDNDPASLGHEDTLQTQKVEPDWWKHTLDLPMKHEPGARYAYCSANINLVGGALTESTKTWLPELFDRTVARPLGFGRYHWNLSATEEGYLGGGAWLRPRDLLKVGQAYLDGGVWRGNRLVSSAWVEESTKARVAISPATTGLSEEEFGDAYPEGEDAYAWHLGELRAGDRAYETYYASGNGGQLLIVAPELEMVVVFTGGNYRQGGIWGRWADEIVGAEIVASMAKP